MEIEEEEEEEATEEESEEEEIETEPEIDETYKNILQDLKKYVPGKRRRDQAQNKQDTGFIDGACKCHAARCLRFGKRGIRLERLSSEHGIS